jgi:hypothetical protein
MEKIRDVSNYAPATERLNMLIRRMKDLRDQGTEIVFLCHEDIQKVYARGGMIAQKGQMPSEPIEIKGQPDFPGNRTPDEMMRAADNVLRIKLMNKVVTAVAAREPLSSGSDYWVTKDRFNGREIGSPKGYFPFDYEKIKAAVVASNPRLWRPPYIWIAYGPPGIGKTRSLLNFPRPLYLFDMDRGTKSIEVEVEDIREKEGSNAITIDGYNVESLAEYARLVANVARLF